MQQRTSHRIRSRLRPLSEVATRLLPPLSLAASLLLASCRTVGPDYVALTPSVAETWLEAETKPGTQLDPCNTSTWWQHLEDATLTQLIERAIDANLDLQQAASRLRQARAQRSVVDANHRPSAQADIEARRSQGGEELAGGDSIRVYGLGVSASWEIDLFGGLRRAREAAAADEQAMAATLADVQVALAAQVGRDYVALRRGQERLRIAQSSAELQRQTLELTAWRAEAGLDTELAVAQAQSNLEQTRANIPALEAAIAESRYRLAFLIAEPPSRVPAELLQSGPIPEPPLPLTIDPPAEVLRRRPDLRVAERTLAAETARVGQATADLYPRLTLRGSLGLEALTVGGLDDDGSETRSLVGSLVAPLLDRRRLRSQVAVQSARQEQALLRYEETLLRILQEVEAAAVAVARGRQQAATLKRASEAARRAGELARLQYESGLLDFQAVLDTDRTLFALEDSAAGARADVVSDVIRLYQALGGGWQPAACSSPEEEPTT